MVAACAAPPPSTVCCLTRSPHLSFGRAVKAPVDRAYTLVSFPPAIWTDGKASLQYRPFVLLPAYPNLLSLTEYACKLLPRNAVGLQCRACPCSPPLMLCCLYCATPNINTHLTTLRVHQALLCKTDMLLAASRCTLPRAQLGQQTGLEISAGNVRVPSGGKGEASSGTGDPCWPPFQGTT